VVYNVELTNEEAPRSSSMVSTPAEACATPAMTCPNPRLASRPTPEHPISMPDTPIERAEVIALLFNVSDIAVTLANIERLLGEDDGEEATDED
jgi:hypothetical protein